MQRRQFLRNSAFASAAALAFVRRSGWAQSHESLEEAQIEILAGESPGVISPNIYGQFIEHIGGVIYDGVWVGENSKIENRYGIRAKLIDALRQIKLPILRWPGGCFADSYDWKDGIGPPEKRPTRTDYWETVPDAARLHERGPQIFETNRFGTNEFIRLCDLTGGAPYLAANVRSLPALDFDRWVEYCNSPQGSTTLAEMRATAGFPSPFNVRYWGVGNENWGCGGLFSPEDYAGEFLRYSVWVPEYGVDLRLIASGPNDDDIDWTHRFFEKLASRDGHYDPKFFGWSAHHYSTSEDALDFDSAGWFDVLVKSAQIEKIICDQWAVMGQYDREHRIKLVVDEYGPSYDRRHGLDPTHIFGQQLTMRDALATALNLDTFNRHPEKVAIAANAQLINCINPLFIAVEDKFMFTPNFHVFDMYSSHQGGQALRAEFMADDVSYTKDGRPASFWGLNGSCSRKGSTVTLTVVNPDVANPRSTQIVLQGARIRAASAVALAATDIHAHNTFEQPDSIRPATLEVGLSSGVLRADFPAASVSKVEITLD